MLAALIKSSQALSEEIVLDKLLAKFMTISIENAGAERGCLLLESDSQLYIAAEADINSNSIVMLPGILMDSEVGRNRVAVAIVNYVTETHESIVIDQATQDERFNQDVYILNHQPKSILCTPLVYQGKRSGILYLENNLTANAFTPVRLEILQFLSTQAAISLDNAQLYNQLELRVQERTRELTQTNDRLQAEILERQRSEQTLRMIVEGTAAVTGTDFYRSLVRSLAQALGVRYAFISECLDDPPTRVRSFAFWQGNEFGDEFEYDLHGTPCERIVNSTGYQCFSAQIQALFPLEKDELAAMQAASYAGIPLLDSTGNLLGHLAVLDDQPMEQESRSQAILEIFAARAGAEMERQQAEKALARLAEIGELAAMIVHEVRNPLATITLGLNAFKKLQLAERFQEYLALSLDEADRLQRLLSQILLYSRPQALDRASVELNGFITETLIGLQTIPAAAGKRLEFAAIAKPLNVLVDRDKFKQILINLVTNACEAINIGDVVTIRLHARANVAANETLPPWVWMQIHNGGTPIAPDVLPQLMKPFFTTKTSGTGLGLAIVKRIVEAHGGELSIESSATTGTIVKVQLRSC